MGVDSLKNQVFSGAGDKTMDQIVELALGDLVWFDSDILENSAKYNSMIKCIECITDEVSWICYISLINSTTYGIISNLF